MRNNQPRQGQLGNYQNLNQGQEAVNSLPPPLDSIESIRQTIGAVIEYLPSKAFEAIRESLPTLEQESTNTSSTTLTQRAQDFISNKLPVVGNYPHIVSGIANTLGLALGGDEVDSQQRVSVALTARDLFAYHSPYWGKRYIHDNALSHCRLKRFCKV
jgi:hypothetical protein